MTVEELIKELKKHNKDLKVSFRDDEGKICNIDTVFAIGGIDERVIVE